MDDGCGYRTDVVATSTGRLSIRTGTAPTTSGFFFVTNSYSFREVHTDPATGKWFVIRGNGQFKEVQATPVGGNLYEVQANNTGQLWVVEDSTGRVVFRQAGAAKFRLLLDTGGNAIPGDDQFVDFLGGSFSGHDPQVSFCAAAGAVIGTDSATRQTAHPLGTTSSPLGYYEYLPPGYGQGKSPLLVFLHGHGGNGDGSPNQLPNVVNDGAIPFYIATNGWATNRPFVVLSPQHNEISSPQYPYSCAEFLVGTCVMQLQHGYGNPLPAGSACWAPAEVKAFIDYAVATYNVDPARVYLTGASCGGYGVWESLADLHAGQIAAAVPVAGDGRPILGSAGCVLASTPIWAFHGEADDVVDPAGSIDPIHTLQSCPSPPAKDLRLTTYPDVGHDSANHVYSGSQGQDIYTWMLSFTGSGG
jgi:hypothetical protein